MQFTSNVGSLDRILRIVVGAALMVLALVGTIGTWGWAGAIFVGTAFMKFCPVYRIFGLKTTKDA